MRPFVTLAAGVALGLAPAVAFAQQAPSPRNGAPQNGAPQNGAPQNQMAPQSDATISDGTIGKVGAALHDVAKLQEKYQGKMESATPEQKRGLNEQANAEAVQAIQSHGLSVQEYSTVVRAAQKNPQVKQRLLAAADRDQ